MTRIVVLDGATLNPGDNPWSKLEELGNVQVYDRTAAAEVLARAAGAKVLVINKVKLPREQLKGLPDLRFVAVTATGYDCIDTCAARDQGVLVANVPVYGTDSVAQHVFALLLHMIHRVEVHDSAIRAGEWAERGDFCFWKSDLRELAGKTFGVIGFGRIGRRIGELAHAFGMRVVAHTRSPEEPPAYASFEWVDLPKLLQEADVISLNCPLTDETRGMVDASFLAHCKANAMLINASRGQLVVEPDLADALNQGRLAAASLDVVATEPIRSDNPLLQARHCFFTPHQAWATLEARQRLMQVTVDNVASFLRGEPQNVVN